MGLLSRAARVTAAKGMINGLALLARVDSNPQLGSRSAQRERGTRFLLPLPSPP